VIAASYRFVIHFRTLKRHTNRVEALSIRDSRFHRGEFKLQHVTLFVIRDSRLTPSRFVLVKNGKHEIPTCLETRLCLKSFDANHSCIIVNLSPSIESQIVDRIVDRDSKP